MDTQALKQAAVDAYMRTAGFNVHVDGEDSLRYILNNFIQGTHIIGIDGTGTSSAGGVTWDADVTSEFAAVRSRIDTALEKWQEDRLPSPGALSARAENAKAAVTALNIGNPGSLGGALGGYLQTINANAPQFRGAAMDAFNNSFVTQLPSVISNHGCLAALVVEAWGAEREIWEKARVDRDALVDASAVAMTAYAETRAPSDIKLVLALTGAVVAGASAIATGGVALPFALATAGLTSLTAINDYVGELEVERRGANYEELMSAFEGGLDDIDQGITKQEQLVTEGLQNAWTSFEENRELFDLTPRVSDNGNGDWGDDDNLFDVTDGGALEIVVPDQAVIDSLSSGMINLAQGLGAASPLITNGADDDSLLAPSAREVGLRYNGASIWMYIIGDNNATSVRDLKWDVEKSNEMVQAVINDFRSNDATSQAALDALRGQLASGSGEDAW